MPVRTRAEDSQNWPMWAGDLEGMRRLVKVVEDVIEEPRRLAIENTAVEDPNRADFVAELWETEMTAVEKELGITHRGLPIEVLGEIDPKVIRRLSISAPNSVAQEANVQLDFSASGVTLQVAGEPGWLRMAGGALKSEVAKGVPAWAWLRASVGWWLYASIAIVALALAIWPHIGPVNARGEPRTFAEKVLLLGLTAAFGAGLAGALMLGLARKVLPGFELLRPNERGRAKGVLTLIGAQVLAFLVGLLVNRAS